MVPEVPKESEDVRVVATPKMHEKLESKLGKKRKRLDKDESELPASKALVTEDTDFEPHAATLDFIRGYHNSVVGHVGVRATMQRIKHAFKQGHIQGLPSNLEAHVKYFRQNCPLCQKVAELRKKAAAPPVHSLAVTRVFQELSIDCFGPLEPTEDGMQYVLAACDGLSRFVFCEPAPDTTAMSAARFIHRLSGRFGFPEAFRWDNCRQFDNHLIACLLHLIGVESHPSVSYNPQSNGKIENRIKQILLCLRFIVNDRSIHDQWADMLPIAERILNGDPGASIGIAPAEIMLPGRDINQYMYPGRQPAMVTNYISNKISDGRARDQVQAYVANMLELQAQAIRSAQQYEDNVVRKRVVDHAPDQVREFRIGDWVVYKWRGGRPTKLSVEWRGPFRVVKRESSTIYWIEDPADLKQYKRHIRELFAYKMGLTDNPTAVIAMDEVEHLVDFIVDHQCGDRKKRSTWSFRVRWQGCGEEEDTWLPFSRVNPLAAFDAYLQEHPELGMG